MQTVLFVLGQVIGVAALLLGVLILAGLGWALVVGGLVVVAGSTAFEALAQRRPSGPSARRSGPMTQGVE